MPRQNRPRTAPLAAALGFAALLLAGRGASGQLSYTGGIPQMLIIGPIDIGPDAGPACDDGGRLAGADYLTDGSINEQNVLPALGDEIAPAFGGLSAGLGVKLVASTAINPRRAEGILTVWKAAADIEGAINFDAGPAKGDGLVIYAMVYLQNLTPECLTAVLEVASDDAVKVRLNGALLGVTSGCRTLAGWGDGDRFPAVLAPGPNVVLLAVTDGSGPNAVRLVVRQADGAPVRDGSILPTLEPPPSFPSSPTSVTRSIAPSPYGPGPVTVTLTSAGIARPTTVNEEFPPDWSVTDLGGGTLTAPGHLRFEITAAGSTAYTVAAPQGLNARFEGKFQAFPCEGQAQDLLVGGDWQLKRSPPGDLAVTGGAGRDIGAVPAAGGQEEVRASPLAFNLFTSGTDIGGAADQGRMVVFSQGAAVFDARCTVAAIDPIDPLTRAGLMVRSACDAGSPAAAGSPFSFIAITAAGGAMFQSRDGQGASAQGIEAPAAAGEPFRQVRLVRRGGDRIEAFARSGDFARWRLIAVKDLTGLGSCLGAAATARHSADQPQIAGASFQELAISSDPLPAALAAPTNLTCRISGRDVALNFTPPPGAVALEVARSGTVLTNFDGGESAYFDQNGARTGAELVYTVTAIDDAGLPGPSATCTVSTCRDTTDAPTASLRWAFDFGAYAVDCPTVGDPSRKFIVLHQSKDRDAAIADAFAYGAARGYGFEVFWKNPADLTLPNPYGDRGGTAVLWGRFGPFDDTLNNRTGFTAGCLEQVYNSFVGAKNFGAFNLIDAANPALGSYPCNEAIAGNRLDPCTPDTILPNGQPYTPEGLVFRMDVPNGAYRFAAAFGDELLHAHRVLAEDGGSGPPSAIGPNHVTLVHNFDQAQHANGETSKNGKPGANVYARVGFDGKLPPPGDGLKPSPVFVNMDRDGKETAGCPDSPILNVTQGAIRIHLLQANSNNGPGGIKDPQGPDMVVFEAWQVEPCPAAGDTHCMGIAVSGPPGNLRGSYLTTATAVDEAADPISYTFEARRGGGPPIVVGPQPENTAVFDLIEGSWTISVSTDDDPTCGDQAADSGAGIELLVLCPTEGDTHCRGLEVSGPSSESGLNPGTFTAAADAEDSTGDSITYTFTVSGGGGPSRVFGPQAAGEAQFDLGLGTWVIRVEVDDVTGCLDAALDSACEKTVQVVPPCPTAGDTHCRGLDITGPPLDAPGTYTVRATAVDDSSDPISYTFTASDGLSAPRVAGPQPAGETTFDLPAGEWTISVEVDDGPVCSDKAADNRCSRPLKVAVPGGRVVPGDCNADGTLDISDAICIIGVLFLGSPAVFPCGDGLPGHAANRTLLDWQTDGGVDISDALGVINFLFLGGPAHSLAMPGQEAHGCVRIIDCVDACQG